MAGGLAGGRAGRQDGEDAAHRRHCFMTAVRHATEAAACMYCFPLEQQVLSHCYYLNQICKYGSGARQISSLVL